MFVASHVINGYTSKDKDRQKICSWLSAPDPTSNHEAARKKQQPTTGTWFVGGSQFEEWKVTSCSFLWLHGIRKYSSVNYK